MSPAKKPNQKPYQKPKKKPPALGQSHTKPWVTVVIVVLVAVLGLGAITALFFQGDDSSDVSTDGSPTSVPSLPAVTSVAGKPCVALVDPLPAGAPAVDVVVGPPPTELVIKDLKVGTGATVEASSTVTIDYIGVACSTGKIFDATFGGQGAVTYPLAQFIPGWQQGLAGMKAGGSRLLGIPPDLAYGDQGSPPDIAGGESLWFVVDVKDVTAATTPAT